MKAMISLQLQDGKVANDSLPPQSRSYSSWAACVRYGELIIIIIMMTINMMIMTYPVRRKLLI